MSYETYLHVAPELSTATYSFKPQVILLRPKQDGKLEHDGEEISTGEASSSERKRKRKKSEEGEISDDGDDVNPKDMVIYSF